MNATPIRFLFDFISPYAWLAWTQVHALATRHGREVEPVPVLFAAMLDAWGHKGPAEIPPKREHLMRDVARHARRLAVPLSPPPAHPFNPLLALRAASLPMTEGQRRALIDALFHETWGGGGGVTDPATIAACAAAIGLDGDTIVRDANSPAAKERVRAQTERAIAEGAFGVPTFIVDGELFWGFDTMHHIEGLLRGEPPIARSLIERWGSIPAGAQRPAAARAVEPRRTPTSRPPEALRARAAAWIDAWNRRDLEAILEHYADDAAVCSPRVVERTGAADGWLRGKVALRSYFEKGLSAPGLRFELIAVTVGVGAMTVIYRRETGAIVTDASELDADGRIVRMVACYGEAPKT